MKPWWRKNNVFRALWSKDIVYEYDEGLNVDQVAKDPRPQGWKDENLWLMLPPPFKTCEGDKRSSSL